MSTIVHSFGQYTWDSCRRNRHRILLAELPAILPVILPVVLSAPVVSFCVN